MVCAIFFFHAIGKYQHTIPLTTVKTRGSNSFDTTVSTKKSEGIPI